MHEPDSAICRREKEVKKKQNRKSKSNWRILLVLDVLLLWCPDLMITAPHYSRGCTIRTGGRSSVFSTFPSGASC